MFDETLVFTDEEGARWEALAEDTNGLLVCVPLGTRVLRLQVTEPEDAPAPGDVMEAAGEAKAQ